MSIIMLPPNSLPLKVKQTFPGRGLQTVFQIENYQVIYVALFYLITSDNTQPHYHKVSAKVKIMAGVPKMEGSVQSLNLQSIVPHHIKMVQPIRKMVITSANYAGKAERAAQKFQHENGLEHHDADVGDPELLSVPKYSYDAFVDAIVEWIIADDQRVVETWQKHIETLRAEMESSQSLISVTMDLLTDLNLVNFMAVTVHWVEAVGTNADGLTIFLGVTMASIWQLHFFILRTGWELQLSWVTMDNAANNRTFMTHLEHSREYDTGLQPSIQVQPTYKMSGQMFCTHYFAPENLNIKHDPIAATRALIHAVHHFILIHFDIKILQPLLDVDSIEKFLDKQDFVELRQYQLFDDEWQALHIIHQILTVPHAFQQQLSADKTLTLALKKLAVKFPDAKPAIKERLCKLNTYFLNPNPKLCWFTCYMPKEAEDAKQLFIRTSTWMDDLLGDNLFDTTLYPQGLEAEVNAYLTDVKSSNDMVKYWQI
ncbi:hypothetical protein EV421DRAFT_1737834 [Armillaria borealis]|uniref:Uncharacterized protein n=1 Tax=Armillaria borealis TaxID=47425 RepID=A0AA39JBJ6_9AGAR|nr:hypothetical protein EV421DRAFT_1737834 [Armillaria borealis]